MFISGPYRPSPTSRRVYLGVLSRRTRVATNTRLVVEAAWPKPVMFFPARFDHWLVQTGDGYAAHIAGAIGVSTDAQASWWGSRGIGTVPHALIAAFGGDTVAATLGVRRAHAGGRRGRVAGRFRQRLCRNLARGRPGARAALVRRPTGHLRNDGRSLRRPTDGGIRPARRQPAPGPGRPERTRRRRLSARGDHRVGRIRSRQDPAIRGGRRAGGLVWRGFVAVWPAASISPPTS